MKPIKNQSFTYAEMLELLRVNNISPVQPMIAREVKSQLTVELLETEFEDVCSEIYNIVVDCIENPNIHNIVDAELEKRGYNT